MGEKSLDTTASIVKRAEAALHESEERLRAIVTNAPVVLFALDREGVFTLSEGEGLEALGFKPGEVVGLSVFELYRDVPQILEDVRRALAGEEFSAMVEVAGLTFETWYYPLREENGEVTGVIGVSTEVTRRKQIAEALREAEERFRSAFDNAPIGVAIVRLDGRYLRVNRSLCEILGYSEEELLSTTYGDLTYPGDVEVSTHYVRQVLEGETSKYHLEKRYLHADGHPVWVSLSVSLVRDSEECPLYFIAQVQDITERKRAEEELCAATSRLTALIENLQAGILVEDGSRRITHVNQEFCSMFDIPVPPQALIGVDCSNSAEEVKVLFAEPERFVQRIEKLLGERRVVTGEELSLADGRVFERDYVPIFVGEDYQGHLWHYRDITERKQAEKALRESEERFQSLADATFEGILINDKGKILEANEALLNMFGYKLEEVVGRSTLEFIAPEYHARTQQNLLSGSEEPYEIVGLRKDGTPLELEIRGKPFSYLGRPVRVAAVRDITERKAFERQLQHQAFHDPLTDLPNRALFMDRLEHALSGIGRREGKVAVLFMDLDNFKVINDSLGHATGDRLLVKVAERLSTYLRPGDTAARLGGDEFTILLEDVKDVSEATRIAERIIEALQTFFTVEEQELFVTTSIGVALSSSSEDRPGDLLRKADLAMHRAKAEGKNLYKVFDPVMNARALERLGLERDLRRALERDELRVYYQPKVSLKSGKIVGEEALVRWEHPERGLVSPAEFVPVSEETGLIVPIGHWVLEKACRQAREWHEKHPSNPPLSMSVNLSARQFQHPNLVQDVAQVLRETGLEAHNLTLEITESVVMEDVRSAIGTLRELKGLGVKIAVDDFGTGHSSLSYLKRFPVDFLKIDRSFISGLGEDPEDKGLVSAVIDLAHTLGLEVVAEGVETEEQLAHLRELGCKLAQGYYFWEPSPGEAAGALLTTHIQQRCRPEAPEEKESPPRPVEVT